MVVPPSRGSTPEFICRALSLYSGVSCNSCARWASRSGKLTRLVFTRWLPMCYSPPSSTKDIRPQEVVVCHVEWHIFQTQSHQCLQITHSQPPLVSVIRSGSIATRVCLPHSMHLECCSPSIRTMFQGIYIHASVQYSLSDSLHVLHNKSTPAENNYDIRKEKKESTQYPPPTST